MQAFFFWAGRALQYAFFLVLTLASIYVLYMRTTDFVPFRYVGF